MNKELLSVVVLFGMLLAIIVTTFYANSVFTSKYLVVLLLVKIMIGAGILGSLIWIIAVMPRVMKNEV